MRSFFNYSKNRFLYGLLKFGILFLLGYLGLSYFTCVKVDAATVSSILYGVKNVTVNGTTSNVTFASSTANLPLMFSQTGATSSFALKSLNFSFNSPVKKSGSSYVITLTYNVNFTDAVAYLLDDSVSLPTSFVRFEQGSVNSQSQATTITKNSGNSFTVKHSATVSLNSTASLSSIVVYLGGETFLGCDPYGIQPSVTCPANGTIPLQLTALNIDVTISEDPNTAILGGIQQEQEKTNEKLDETNEKLDDLKEQQEESNKTQEEIKDAITDETPPNLSGLENSAGWLPAGPVDSILNLPISLLNNLTDNLGGSCQPANLTIPFINKEISLPCMSEIYEKIGISAWINTIGTLASAFIAYYYLLELYKWVDNVLTMRENQWNDVDQWGGI